MPTRGETRTHIDSTSVHVTNGDSHDHNGGDGAQIDHVNLANKGTNTHSTIDSHISSTAGHTRVVGVTIDGGGSAIAAGQKGYFWCPFGGTISAWTITGDVSGAIKIDVWKDVYANGLPTNADSICNGHEPEIAASGTVAQDTDLADWTTQTITAGDVFGFYVDSCATITRATLVLKVTA